MAIRIYGKDEIVQGSKEWFEIRKLKFTASKASEIMTAGAGLETLVKELLQDCYSSGEYEEYSQKYKNDAMKRGNDFEAMARMVYEFETGNTVTEVGFVELNEHVGASPDGFVDGDAEGKGLVEIKNHSDKVYLELLFSEKIDPKYLKQMQYQMYVTGQKWCDYMGFNPNFGQTTVIDEDTGEPLLDGDGNEVKEGLPNCYIKRVYADASDFQKIEHGLSKGIERLKELKEVLEKKYMVAKAETLSNEMPF